MSSIDSRIVQLKFDNASFEANVRTTLTSLDKLKASLDGTASKGHFANIGQQAGAMGQQLGGLHTIVDGVSARFLALGTVAVTALANITTAAMNAGVQLAKSLAIDPIMTGFKEYETQMNSVQTILSNTQAAGTKLKDVTAALDQLNEYSDKTIYNFTEMTKNIGAFTAAGVGLDESVDAIKGIANLAAMSGSNSEQASRAMYQLSQAIAAGRVTLADWNSVANAGMGGAVFQRNLAETAVAMGVLDENAVKLTGDMKKVTINGEAFRSSISAAGGEETWLTSEVLTTALSTFTGDLNDAELAAIGFSKAQIKAIQAQAQTAVDAATQVKTLTQVFDVAKETMGSGWAQTFKILFGDFKTAKGTFTELSNTINGFIQTFSDARNELLKGWAELGGREAVIEGIKNVFQALGNVLKPIGEAFRQIFPAATVQDLVSLSERFRDFTEKLKIGADTANTIKRVFAGVFAVFKIGATVIRGVFSAIGNLLGPLGTVSGGFLDLAARVGDWLVALNDTIQKSGVVTSFFENLGEILSAPIEMVIALGEAFTKLFAGNYNIETAGAVFDRVGERMSALEGIISGIKNAWTNFLNAMTSSDSVIGRFINNVRNEFRRFGDAVAEGLSSGDFSAALDVINTGLFAGILLMLKRFVDNGAAIFNIGFGGKMAENFNNFTSSITKSLNTLTLGVKANALLKIAIAIGILSASLVALSLVDSKKLLSGIAGMTTLFVELTAALTILDTKIGGGGAAKLPIIGAGLILIATGLLALTAAVRVLAKLDVDELAKGLTGVAASMAILVAPVAALGKTAPSMIIAAGSMLVMAVALNAMALAVRQFGNLDWDELGQGLAGVAAAMLVLVGAMHIMPAESALRASVSMIAIATAVTILSVAVERLGSLDMPTIGKGLGSVAASLGILVGAMHLMPKDMIRKSAGVLVLSIALLAISKALESMGDNDPAEIAKSLITLAGALGIIAVALNNMTKALPGAAALAVVAAALLVFVPALAVLGSLPVPVIVTGLLALAAAFAVLGIAGIVLSEAIPAIIGLAASLLMVGAAVALVGAGVWLFVKALQVLVEIGKTAGEVIANSFLNIGKAIPAMMATITAFLIALASTIAAVAPEWQKAFTAVLNEMLKSFIKVAPKAKKAIDILIDILLTTVNNKADDFLETGFNLLIYLLRGLSDKIRPIVDAAVDLVKNFTSALGDRVDDLIEAGAQLVLDILNGITEGYWNNKAAFETAGRNLAYAIADGMTFGISSRVGELVTMVGNVASDMLQAAKDRLGIASPSKEFKKIGKAIADGLIYGLVDNRDPVVLAVDDLMKSVTDRVKTDLGFWSDEVERLKDQLKQAKEEGASADKIKKLKDKLDEARDATKKLSEAQRVAKEQAAAHRNELISLQKQLDKYKTDLTAAEQLLTQLTSAADSFQDSLETQYSALPDIQGGEEPTTLDAYFNSVRDSTAANQEFLTSLNELRAMGLDRTTYEKLLAEGVEAQPFIDSLKAAGPAAVAELANINAALTASAEAISTTGRSELYQAAIDAQQGVVDGLKASISLVEAQMTDIARAMVRAIKKELKIKSPSLVFAMLGKQSNMGLAKGLEDYTKLSSKAAEHVGESAVDTLKSSLDDISHLDFEPNLDPVITPVLDLETFMKEASSMRSMLPSDAIVPVSGKLTADKIAQMDAVFESLAASLSGAGTSIEYNQYNNSPKALSSAEIYRRTKNQLSVLKGVLNS